jgi:hypothetical protein
MTGKGCRNAVRSDVNPSVETRVDSSNILATYPPVILFQFSADTRALSLETQIMTQRFHHACRCRIARKSHVSPSGPKPLRGIVR